jgi:hypothetical protein
VNQVACSGSLIRLSLRAAAGGVQPVIEIDSELKMAVLRSQEKNYTNRFIFVSRLTHSRMG